MTSSTQNTPKIGSESPVSHRRENSLGTSTTIQSEFPANDTSNLYEHPWDRQCVLSLDGGGIRGYSSLIILGRLMREIHKIEIESLPEGHKHNNSSYDPEDYIPCINNAGINDEEAQSRSGEAPCGECCRYLPCHYFDYIGGTSTGGLISILLGRLRMSVHNAIEEYERLAGAIFGNPRLASIRGPIPWLRDKYDGRTIQRAVEDVIERRMSKSERQIGAGNFTSPPGLCRTLVFAYASKISSSTSEYGARGKVKNVVEAEDSAPYIFRSYDHWGTTPPTINERNPGVAANIPIWEVARATTAAPFYFEPIQISNRKFGDGGFGTNNPAEEMLAEVSSMNGHNPNSIALLLSIGTGEVAISRFENGPFGKYLAYLNAARRLASDSAAAHQRLEGQRIRFDIPYHRFNVPLDLGLGKMKLDEWKKGTLEKIRSVTDKYCDQDEVRDELREVAKILVNHRKDRAKSDLWGFVSSGLQYRCAVEKCSRCQELRPRRKDLETHLREKHGLNDNVLRKKILEGMIPPPEKKRRP